MLKPFATRTHQEMKDVLLNPNALGPEVFYYMIRGGKEKTNVTVWEVGKVGDEYIKTYGHYHLGDISETYKVAEGEGVVLLQKRKVADGKTIDDQIEFFIAIKVKKGDEVFIPSGVGHLVANTGNTYLVTVDDSPVNFAEVNPVSLPGHADYEGVKKMHGFAYYLIEEAGEGKLVKNPLYKNLPVPEWITSQDWNQRVYKNV